LPARAATRRNLVPWICLGVSGWLVALVAVGIAAWSLTLRPASAPSVATVPTSNTIPNAEIENTEKATAARDAANKNSRIADAPGTTVAKVDEPPPVMPKDDEPPPMQLSPVFKDIEAKGKVLSLPKLERGLIEDEAEPQELCKIYIDNLDDCTLSLVTAETFDGEQRLRLIPETESPPGQRAWTVESHTKNPAVARSQAVPIGQFVLHDATKDHALTFAWANDLPEWSNAFGLAYCKLEVEVGEDMVACQLSKPVIIPPEKLRIQTRGEKIPIPIPAGSLASLDKVRFDVELARRDAVINGAYQNPATDPKPVKIRIPGESPDGAGDVEFEFRFLPPDKTGAEFACAAFVFPATLSPAGLGWKKVVQRVDQLEPVLKDAKIDIKVKEGIVLADMERLAKLSRVHETRTINSIRSLVTEVKKLDSELEEFANAKDLDKDEIEKTNRWNQERELALKKIQQGEELIAFGKEFVSWTDMMRSQLHDLEKTIEIRYSVYLDLGDERAVIAQTERAPRRPARSEPAPAPGDVSEPDPPPAEEPEPDKS
jgi:hypothetical protein